MNRVLNFHYVYDHEWFEEIICFLKSKYELISAETLLDFHEGHIHIKNTCHITIDDGEKSFHSVMFPILKKYNVPATLFISPKIINENVNYWFQEILEFDQIILKKIIADVLKVSVDRVRKFNANLLLKTLPIQQILDIIRNYQITTQTSATTSQNMTVENLLEVDQSGLIAIGAHTLNHPILANEDDICSFNEISGSINELSNLLNHEVRYFAYPNGKPYLDFTEREMNYLRNCGIKLAFAIEPKNTSMGDNMMSIPRIAISSNESIYFTRAKLHLGNFGYPLKKFKPKGEYQKRKRLNRILN